jgi:ABC-type polysaccharide/polyol phosphate export permease
MLRAFSYWMLQYKRTWRGTIVISVANPLLFLIGIGAGLGKLVDHHAPAAIAGVPYVAFFAPGLLAASAMQTGFLEGARVRMAAAPTGAYRSEVTTPLDTDAILGGHLLFILFRVVTSSIAFIAVMALFGATRSWWSLGVLPAVTLTGMAFAAPAAAWCVTVTKSSNVTSVFRFVIVPLYMFSGTFFAIAQLPSWLRPIAALTPLYQGVQLCRTLALGTASLGPSLAHIAYLLVLAVGGVLVGRYTFRKVLHT